MRPKGGGHGRGDRHRLREDRVSKVVGLTDGARVGEFVVLNELDGDRHLVIQIGSTEAFALAASLGDVAWDRPMTYQFMAELVRSPGGRIPP